MIPTTIITPVFIRTPPVVWPPVLFRASPVVRAIAAIVTPAGPRLTIMPESIIPVPAVMPAVLDITIPLDFLQAVPTYGRRKIVSRDTFPWSFEVISPVPGTIFENEEVIRIINDVIWCTIGYREAIVIQIDEIWPDCQMNFRITRNSNTQNLDPGKCFRLRLAR
jgi:hypothetical protein